LPSSMSQGGWPGAPQPDVAVESPCVCGPELRALIAATVAAPVELTAPVIPAVLVPIGARAPTIALCSATTAAVVAAVLAVIGVRAAMVAAVLPPDDVLIAFTADTTCVVPEATTSDVWSIALMAVAVLVVIRAKLPASVVPKPAVPPPEAPSRLMFVSVGVGAFTELPDAPVVATLIPCDEGTASPVLDHVPHRERTLDTKQFVP